MRATARPSILRVSDGRIPKLGHSPNPEVKKPHQADGAGKLQLHVKGRLVSLVYKKA